VEERLRGGDVPSIADDQNETIELWSQIRETSDVQWESVYVPVPDGMAGESVSVAFQRLDDENGDVVPSVRYGLNLMLLNRPYHPTLMLFSVRQEQG